VGLANGHQEHAMQVSSLQTGFCCNITNTAVQLQLVVVRQYTIVVTTPRFTTTLVAYYLSMQQHCGQSAVRHSDGISCKVTLAATVHMEVCTDTSNNPVFKTNLVNSYNSLS